MSGFGSSETRVTLPAFLPQCNDTLPRLVLRRKTADAVGARNLRARATFIPQGDTDPHAHALTRIVSQDAT